jgi:hypothetical protein
MGVVRSGESNATGPAGTAGTVAGSAGPAAVEVAEVVVVAAAAGKALGDASGVGGAPPVVVAFAPRVAGEVVIKVSPSPSCILLRVVVVVVVVAGWVESSAGAPVDRSAAPSRSARPGEGTFDTSSAIRCIIMNASSVRSLMVGRIDSESSCFSNQVAFHCRFHQRRRSARVTRRK